MYTRTRQLELATEIVGRRHTLIRQDHWLLRPDPVHYLALFSGAQPRSASGVAAAIIQSSGCRVGSRANVERHGERRALESSDEQEDDGEWDKSVSALLAKVAIHENGLQRRRRSHALGRYNGLG